MTEHDIQSSPTHNRNDILWRHLKTLPAFRALLRAVEARFYHQVELPEPVLDLGCGDGNFVELTFNGRQLGVGLDPWWNPLRKAKKAEIYKLPLQGMGDQMPFADGHFASAISNSVLEHIPDIQPVLDETGRVMKMGGRFVMTMPNHRFTECLGGAQFFERMGQEGLAERYRNFFNYISRHAHTESIEWWAEKLAHAGFAVERWQYYFSEKALHTLELGHAQGLPSAVLHALTGQWILSPTEASLSPTERWVRPFFEEEADGDGTYLLIIARKVANHPIPVQIPEPQPFTQEELARGEATMFASDEDEIIDEATYDESASVIADVETTTAASATTTQPSSRGVTIRRAPSLVGTGLYLLGILLPAIFGQSILNSDPTATGRGFFWYGVSLFFLLILGWSRQEAHSWPRLRLPTLSEVTGPIGFFVAGLVLSWLAFSFVRTPGVERPTIALALWLLAIVVTTYGFWPLMDAWPLSIRSRQTVMIAGGLFIVAAVVRFWDISGHPFIISGTEANTGREALMVNAGQWQNPFGTSFLTNPSLPLYLIGLPLRIFGRTALAIRFWSAVMGALTVAATYLIGQKLWNRSVGITAAILLAGSHWHIHYSRIGLTNVWDPFLSLIALGLLVFAWREKNRILWILTGVALGLNAYLFTSSHILPLILVAFLLIQPLFNWSALRANGRYLLMAAGLAFVIALPLILFYNTNDTIFMERANQYGIFQTGWVAREAAQTGQSTITVVWNQIKQSLLAFNATADASAYYGVNQPLLGFWAAIAFVLGLAIALFRVKEPQNLLLVIWVLATAVFAGGLLIESPASHRLLIAAPAVMLLAGLALSEFGQLLLKARPVKSATAAPSAVTNEVEQSETETTTGTTTAATTPNHGRYHTYQFIALALLAIAMVVPDLLFYFSSYRQETTFGDPNTEIAHMLGSYMRDELTGDEILYFIAPPAMYVGFPTITYFGGEKFSENVNLFNVEPLASENAAEYLPEVSTQPAVFIVIPSRFSDLGALRIRYPEGTMRQIPGYYNDPLFVIYEVNPSN